MHWCIVVVLEFAATLAKGKHNIESIFYIGALLFNELMHRGCPWIDSDTRKTKHNIEDVCHIGALLFTALMHCGCPWIGGDTRKTTDNMKCINKYIYIYYWCLVVQCIDAWCFFSKRRQHSQNKAQYRIYMRTSYIGALLFSALIYCACRGEGNTRKTKHNIEYMFYLGALWFNALMYCGCRGVCNTRKTKQNIEYIYIYMYIYMLFFILVDFGSVHWCVVVSFEAMASLAQQNTM